MDVQHIKKTANFTIIKMKHTQNLHTHQVGNRLDLGGYSQ